MQDRIDGGITLLIRSCGYALSEKICPQASDVALDVYYSPRELAEGGLTMQSDIAIIMQAFTKDFVIPHLQHFTERCRIEGVNPPNPPCERVLVALLSSTFH